MLGIEAEVSHPTHSGSYAVDDYGRPMMLPGMSGVVANVRVGDPVFRWAADHLEPGVSAGCADRGRHQALQFLACVGNPVRVVSGPAKGAEGTVVGKHAFVLVDFPSDVLDLLAPGDRLLVRVHGQGLRLLDFPEIVTRSCSPALVEALPLRDNGDGRIRVEVAAEIPSPILERHGVEDLRLGDVVAMHDQDHRFGRGFKPGLCAIGVVAHGGHGAIPGHGTGVATIMSGPAEQFGLVRAASANLRECLKL